MPVGVVLSNQFQFLIASPAFYLLFSLNCRKDIAERFDINQCIDLVAVGKAFDQSGFVLPNSSVYIIGDPDI